MKTLRSLSMADDPALRLRRRDSCHLKRAVVSAAMAAVLLAACGGGSPKNAAAKSTQIAPIQETSTTVAAGTTTSAPAAGRTATTSSASKPATSGGATVSGRPASNSAPPAGGLQAKPATPGTYHYDTTGSSTVGGQSSTPPPVSPLVIDPPARTRQHSAHDDRDAAGNGSVTETTLDFQPQGVYLLETKITTKTGTLGSQTVEFTANPPALAAPTGVKPGQSVVFDLTGSGAGIHVRIDFLRMESVTVGGQTVDTIVLHQVATFSGSLTGTQTSDSWVVPKDHFVVKDHTVSDITAYGSLKAHSDITSALERLTPS